MVKTKKLTKIKTVPRRELQLLRHSQSVINLGEKNQVLGESNESVGQQSTLEELLPQIEPTATDQDTRMRKIRMVRKQWQSGMLQKLDERKD